MRKKLRKERELHRFWNLLVVILLFIPYLQGVFAALPKAVNAEENPTKVLLQNKDLTVETTSKTTEGKVAFEINVDVAKSTNERRVKFLLKEAGTVVATERVHSTAITSEKNNWLALGDFSSQGGVQKFAVDGVVGAAIQLEVQLDERAGSGATTPSSAIVEISNATALTSGTSALTASSTAEAVPVVTELLTSAEQGPYTLLVEKNAEKTIESSASSSVPEVAEKNSTEVESSSTATKAVVSPKNNKIVDRRNLMKTRIGKDPFDYVNTAEESFATHSTDQQIGGTTSTYVKNYNYGEADSKNLPELFNITPTQDQNKAQKFDNGYVQYDDALMKKTVKATDDPNKFDITLDVIGNANKNKQNVDVVFVVDKSSSMNSWEQIGSNEYNRDTSNYEYKFLREWGYDYYFKKAKGDSRWETLQPALISFINNLLPENNSGNVQIAVTSFGSELDDSRNAHVFTEVTNFSGNPFTDSAENLIGSSLVSEAPPDNSGTPTFLGLDSGITTLENGREDAKKVLIFLSDGSATFGVGKNYVHGGYTTLDTKPNNLINGLHYSFTNTEDEDGNSIEYYIGEGTKEIIGNRNKVNLSDETREYFKNVENNHLTYQFNSIAYYIPENSTGAEGLMAQVGLDGQFKSSDSTSLVNALDSISTSINGSIVGATITDPMSEQVTLSSPVKINNIVLKDGVVSTVDKSSLANSSSDNRSIYLSNVDLGGDGEGRRDGVRITYTVEVKEKFRDDKFHLTNGPTSLRNNGVDEYVPVPAVMVKVPVAKVEFTKQNEFGKTISGIDFELTSTDGKGREYSTSSKENGNVLFAEVKAGTYTLHETNVPDGLIGADIEITVKWDGSVSGLPVNKIITNKFKPFILKLIKVDESKERLEGVTFNLFEQQGGAVVASGTTNEDGEISAFVDRERNDYPIKPTTTYYLKEVQAPEGYQELPGYFELVVSETGDATKLEVNLKYLDEQTYLKPVNDAQINLAADPNLSNTVQVTILNEKEIPPAPLPKTGGIGVTVFIASGFALMTSAGFYFLLRRQ